LAELTLQAGSQTFPFLVNFVDAVRGEPCAKPVAIESFIDAPEHAEASMRLKFLLDKHGSDKADRHNYHNLYGPILADMGMNCVLLEIGLGTNYVDVPSNMGPTGRPGASLRAFSEFRPQAQIFGADVDQRILFTEGNIKTFFVDQTDPRTFDDLAGQINQRLDLVIDDGLHSPNANLATMTFALNHLKPGGWCVIEDIYTDALPIWQVVSALMPKTYTCYIISSRETLMFAVRRGPN
jgi:hypothetical protein